VEEVVFGDRLARIGCNEMRKPFVGDGVAARERAAERVFERDADAARALFDKLSNTLRREPEATGSNKNESDEDLEWDMSAWNSAARNLTTVLLTDPILNDTSSDTPLPRDWTERAEALLALPGNNSRFCLVRLAGHLSWLFARDAVWTEMMILAVMDRDGTDRNAALAGFFSNPKIIGERLFVRLKPMLIGLAAGKDRLRHHKEHALAALCITAWLQKTDTGQRWLSDEELRTVLVYCSTNMRTHILWHVDKWPSIEDKLTLLKDVWPLQLAARSPAVTGRLCTIAFDNEANFPALVDANHVAVCSRRLINRHTQRHECGTQVSASHV
jgi:hypothetical protein